MTKILDDYIKFIDFFAKKFEPKTSNQNNDDEQLKDENIDENSPLNFDQDPNLIHY